MSTRPCIIAGNWKMYNDLTQTESLIKGITSGLTFDMKNVKAIVCPPFTSLSLASALLKNAKVALGAQNMHFENEGAFTGEISASMLRSAGCSHVILGHSERRKIFGETDAWVNTKTRKALTSGLIPIVCVGETLEEREGNKTLDVVGRQVRGAFKEISEADAVKCIVAYEPVWAIGTGKTATPAQAQEVHAAIRQLLATLYSSATAESIVIQYGGSVKPENAAELLSQKDIDGALVGGACLKAESFLAIIKAGVK